MQRRSWLRIEWIWLAVLIALLTLHFWFPRVGSGPVDDSYSTTATGEKAFYLLVENEYLDVGRNTDPLVRSLAYFSPQATLCLLGPARNPTPAEWALLLEWVANGGGLLYAADHDKPALQLPEIDLEIKQTKKSTRDPFVATNPQRTSRHPRPPRIQPTQPTMPYCRTSPPTFLSKPCKLRWPVSKMPAGNRTAKSRRRRGKCWLHRREKRRRPSGNTAREGLW